MSPPCPQTPAEQASPEPEVPQPGSLWRKAVWALWGAVVMLALAATLGYEADGTLLRHGWPWEFAVRRVRGPLPLGKRWQFWDSLEQASAWALAADLALWSAVVLAGTHLVRRWLAQPRPGRLTLPRLFALVAAAALLVAVWSSGRHDQRVVSQLRRDLDRDAHWLQQHLGAPDAAQAISLTTEEEQTLDWLDDLLGGRLPIFRRVWFVAVRSLDPGRDLDRLARLRHLRGVFVGLPEMDPRLREGLPVALSRQTLAPSARQWAQLNNCPRLEHLAAYDCQLRGESLRGIAQLGRLRELSLARNPIADDDLALLAPLRQLQELDLAFTEVTDEGMPHLLKLPRLQLVDLTGTRVTDAGVELLESRGISVVDD